MNTDTVDWITVKFTKENDAGRVSAGFVEKNGNIDKIVATGDTFRECLKKMQALAENLGINKFSIVANFETELFPESEVTIFNGKE